MRERWSLARQLMVLQGAVVVLVVGLAAALAYGDARRDAHEAAEQRTSAVAGSVADSPDVRDAVELDDPAAVLQPYAEQVRIDTGTDFVVVMSPEGTRWSHPDVSLIGRPFVGTTAPALEGRTFSETFTGSLGPSVRTVTPVRAGPDGDGEVVALVAVGITVDRVGAELRRQLPALVLAVLAVLLLAAGGSWLISRRLRRQTFDLGPAELARMYGYYDAVLHSVREGLLLVDADGRLQLANEEAGRLLALPPDARGRQVDDLGLPGDLVAAFTRPDPVVDELLVARDRVVAVSVALVGAGGGRVVTLRDRTDLQRLTGELDSTRGLAEALRSAQHEAANRLHTVVALIELGRPEEAVQFAVGELAAAQTLTDSLVAAVREPVVAALLLGKSAVAAERGSTWWWRTAPRSTRTPSTPPACPPATWSRCSATWSTTPWRRSPATASGSGSSRCGCSSPAATTSCSCGCATPAPGSTRPPPGRRSSAAGRPSPAATGRRVAASAWPWWVRSCTAPAGWSRSTGPTAPPSPSGSPCGRRPSGPGRRRERDAVGAGTSS